MSTWSDAPKIQGPPQTEDVSVLADYVKKLANVTAKMAKDLEFILNGNVAFDNIQANGIKANNIQAGAITTEKLQAGAVTADKITVNELSAITANLGHITAGLIEAVEIYGSLISGGTVQGATVTTRVGNGKGIVLKSGWADLEIYSGLNNANLIFSIRDLLGDASIVFEGNGDISAIYGDLSLRAQRIFINAPDGVFVNGVQIG